MKTFTLCLATGLFLFFVSPAKAQNNAMNFDGTNDRIIVPPLWLYDFEYGTVEFWVRPQGLVGNACIIGNRSFGGTRWSLHMSTTLIGLFDGYGYGAVNYTTTPGQWYHIAFVCSPSNTIVYVNGNMIGLTNNVIMGWEYNSWEYEGITGQELSIGSVRDQYGAYEHFKGDIDDIRIWDHTRTQAQIQLNKDNTLNGTEPGLVALFNFDEGIASGNNTGVSQVAEFAMGNPGYLWNFSMAGTTSNFIPRFTALPVVMTGFKAIKQNTSALLQWNTSSEQNSQSFVIERSQDGNSFSVIGSVAAARNSNTTRTYKFEDAAPLKGNNYYRLKQVDVDGKFTYSEVRTLNFSGDSKLSWHSAGRTATVQLQGGGNEPYTVTNMNGETVMQGRLAYGKLLISTQPAGIYHVRVKTASGMKTVRVVVH